MTAAQTPAFTQLYPRRAATMGANPQDLGLKRASEIAPSASKAQAEPEAEPKAKGTDKPGAPVTLSVTVLFESMPVTISVAAPLNLRNLNALRDKLKRLGLEPVSAVAATEGPSSRPAEGMDVMCPIHHVRMKRRVGDDNKDVWHSHMLKDDQGRKVRDSTGKLVFCRGHD